MNVILVTGGAIGDLPVILAAKKRGLKVITSGNRADDVGHLYSDLYVPADYTNVSALSEIVIGHKVDYIYSSAHDLAYVAAAQVASLHNLPGYDTPEIAHSLHNKGELRDALTKLNIATPNFIVCKSEAEFDIFQNEIKFPAIVKPVDLTGGNGVTKTVSLYQAKKAFDWAYSLSPSKQVIVEEFLDGSYHGCSVIIRKGRIVFSFFDNECYFYDKYRVSGTEFPTSVSRKSQNILLGWIELLATSMGLVDGLIHTQFIETKLGPVLLEVCRRTPGDLYPDFVSGALEIDYPTLILSPYIGLDVKSKLASNIDGSGHFFRFILMPKRRGEYLGISDGSFFTPVSKFEWRKPGTYIENPRSTPCGIYFYRATKKEDVETLKEFLPLKMNVELN